MALTIIERNVQLDVYDHDLTPSTIKAIALDSKTRYVGAEIHNGGQTYNVGQNTAVTLTIIRPDKTGVQITGETFEYTVGEGETVYGAYAELTQTALAVKGTLRAQFMLTSGDQVLRTEIFAINCGEALDASTDTWAGEYQGYNLDELVQNVNTAVGKVDAMEQDVSELKSGLSELDSIVNGSGGGSEKHTVELPVDWEDGRYIEYSTGKKFVRTGYSCNADNLIAIPDNAETITIKGSSALSAVGYCFYTNNNVSYPVNGSGASLKGTGIVEVTVDIPDGATHLGISTQTADIASSGAWYTYTEVKPEDGGIKGDVSLLQAEQEATQSGIETLITDLSDSADDISWTDGQRIIRIYGARETSGYRLGEFSAHRGDRVIITHNTALPKSVVQIAEVIDIADKVTYRPLTAEVPTASIDYIVPYDMTVVVSVKTANLTAIRWYKMPVLDPVLGTEDRQTAIFPYGKTVQIMGASRSNPMNKSNRMQKPLVLAHISDIHNSRPNETSFKRFLDIFGGYVDDAILTGDIAGTKYPDYVPTYAQDGYKNVLLTIGNHDVYDVNNDAESHGANYYDREYFASEKQTYDKYFAPSISQWGVTQPSNASTNGYCYYYKDYNVNNGDSHTVATVRLIVLDPMHYNANQHAWLVSTLAAAKTSNVPVVIAEHFIPMETTDDMNLFDTPFSSLMTGMRDMYGLYFLSYLDGDTRHKAADVVDDFISGGGEFICWICGHMHFDLVGTLKSHPNQIFIAVGSANAYPINAYADMPREYGMESENLINIVSFDTYNKTIRVGRIGAKIDDHMRHRGGMCINYSAKTLVNSW